MSQVFPNAILLYHITCLLSTIVKIYFLANYKETPQAILRSFGESGRIRQAGANAPAQCGGFAAAGELGKSEK